MAIVIDAQLGLSGGATRNLTQLAKLADQIRKNMAGAADQMRRFADESERALANIKKIAASAGISPPGTRSGGSRAQGGRGTGRRTTPPRIFDYNPRGGMDFYRNAAAQGDVFAGRMYNHYKNLHGRNQRNQRQARAAQNPHARALAKMFGGKIGNTLMKAGELEALAPLLAVLAPLLAVVVGVLVAIAIFSKALELANKAARYFALGLVQSAAGGMQSSWNARMINQTTGANFVGAAHNTNPIVASMAGISPFTGPFGDMDYNERARKLYNTIRRQKTYDQARRVAELMGDPEAASAWWHDDQTAGMMNNKKKSNSPWDNSTVSNFNAQRDILMDNLERIKAKLLEPLMVVLRYFFAGLNMIIDWINEHLFGGKKNEASDKFDAAVNRFSNAVNDVQGAFGGGSAAASANRVGPAAWNPGFGSDASGVL